MKVCVGLAGVTKYNMKVCVMNGYLSEMDIKICEKIAIKCV